MNQWIITPDKYLKDEEVKRLMKTCEENAELARAYSNWIAIRDYMIIDFALNTGLRVQEISDLKTEDLNIQYGESSLVVQHGKGDKKRVVRFSKNLKAHIKQYLAERKDNSPFLFSSSRGEQLTRSALQKIFKARAREAGLPEHYSIHSLRHTFATRLYRASGYNLRLVQKELGHSNIQTTTVYSDVSNDEVEKALERLDEDS